MHILKGRFWPGIMFWLLCASSGAQDAATSGVLYLKFLDSTTRGGIEPEQVLVDEAAVDFEVEAGSIVALTLGNGSHSIAVEAENYSPMEFTATVAGTETPVMEIELDRASSTEVAPVADDAAVLEGNITDADTGALLEKVKVTLPDARLTTVTAADGYYRFEVIVGTANESARPAVTMEVKAEGYTPIRAKNLSLAAGERRRMPVKLSRVTSDTLAVDVVETDENAVDGYLRTSDWTFDVTVH